MERSTETLDLEHPVDWEFPRIPRNGGWDLECRLEDSFLDETHIHYIQFRTFSKVRAMTVAAEARSTTIDRLTRMRISALEQQVAQLLDEVARLRRVVEIDAAGADSNASIDPALGWISDNTITLEAYSQKYVAFTPSQGIVAVAATLKELYLLLEGRERDVHIHYVAEPLVLKNE